MSSQLMAIILLIYLACLSTSDGQKNQTMSSPSPGANYTGQPGPGYTGSPGANYTGPPGYSGQPGPGYTGPPGSGYTGQPIGPGGPPNSPKDMQHYKDMCKQVKAQLIDQLTLAEEAQQQGRPGSAGATVNRASIEQSTEFQNLYPPECRQADSFSYRNLTRDEALMWLYSSYDDPGAVYGIARDISQEILRELLFNASRMGWGMPGGMMEPILQAIVDIYIQRLGGLQSITIEQLRFLGSTIVYTIPAHVLDRMPREMIDTILEHITTATVMSMNPMPEQWDPNGPPPYDFAASLPSLMMDIGRLKALCRTVWQHYRTIDNEVTFNKTWIFLFCAPHRVCRDLSVNIVQNNRDAIIGFQMWKCHSGNIDAGNHTQHMDNFFRNFPGLTICARHLANRIVAPGPNQLVIDTGDKLLSMGSLSLCLPDEYLMRGVELVGCPMAMQGLTDGIFSKKMEKFVAARCLTIPTDLSGVTCANITSSFGPLLKYLDHNFWSGLPSGVLCDTACMAAFKQFELPSNVRMGIMNRCYSGSNVAITTQVVQDLGALVTKLPIDKLETVSAADLATTVQSIKEDYQATKSQRKHDPRRKAIARTIAKKMASSGDITAITDSEDMMQTVSLKDLRNAVSANVEQDLGLDQHDVALTDSQNKWVMRKIMENKQATNFSADDIRSKKSLVKGFLSKDIHNMGEAHNDSGIELAKALCEQTNWPMKPLKAINRDMIKKSLEARNSTHPMEALTDMDVSSIGCECLMHFKSPELGEMDRSICSAVCEKVGYCNNFRCLNSRHRRNFLQACLSCKDLGVNVFTEAEMDELGPNLISQLSSSQVSTLIPSSVLMTQIGSFKEMCMTRDFRTMISTKLVEVYGSGIDYDTLTMLGSGVMMFPQDTLQNMNLSFVAELAETFVSEIAPTDEVLVKLQQCCHRWLQTDDIVHYNELKHNLLIVVKDAIIYKMQNPSRKKRNIVSWTCANMRLVSEAFTTVSDAEINNMNDTEFIDCLADIGSLTSWSAAQKTVLLAKTETAFGVPTVCNMTTTDLLNIGVIGEAMTTAQINCLPLDEDDIVASFGAMPAWTTAQLVAFATTYLSTRNLADISNFTSADVSLVGHLLCGFAAVQLAAIPAATIGASGSQLGSLSHCPVAQLVQLKTLAIDPNAYGAIVNWTAAEVGELKFVLAGLVGTEIQGLSADSLEGLSSEVIPRIPVNTLKEMTASQLEAFTDVQAVTVTTEQRAAMSAAQIAILDDATTGGQEEQPEVTAAPPPSTGTVPDVQSVLLLLGSVLIMLLLST